MSSRTNPQWLAALQTPGPAQELALADLRALLQRGLPYAVQPWLTRNHPQFEAFMDDVIQEALVRILARFHTFAGKSQFTTWAQKVALRVAMAELRRRRWREVSLDELVETDTAAQLLADPLPRPEDHAARTQLRAQLQQLLREELTEKQRRALVATSLHGMPLEEVAHQLGLERNTLYKLLHDGRLKLKRRLQREGWLAADVLTTLS